MPNILVLSVVLLLSFRTGGSIATAQCPPGSSPIEYFPPYQISEGNDDPPASIFGTELLGAFIDGGVSIYDAATLRASNQPPTRYEIYISTVCGYVDGIHVSKAIVRVTIYEFQNICLDNVTYQPVVAWPVIHTKDWEVPGPLGSQQYRDARDAFTAYYFNQRLDWPSVTELINDPCAVCACTTSTTSTTTTSSSTSSTSGGGGVTCKPLVSSCPATPITNTYRVTSQAGPRKCVTNSPSNAFGACTDDAQCGSTEGTFNYCLATPWETIGPVVAPFPTGVVTTFRLVENRPTCRHPACIACESYGACSDLSNEGSATGACQGKHCSVTTGASCNSNGNCKHCSVSTAIICSSAANCPATEACNSTGETCVCSGVTRTCCNTPSFDVPAVFLDVYGNGPGGLGACQLVNQTGCGDGVVDSSPTQHINNVVDVAKDADTSDPGPDCTYQTTDPTLACITAAAGADSIGKIIRTVGNLAAAQVGIHSRFHIPVKWTMWNVADATACPSTTTLPANATIITQFDLMLEPTTGTATARFTDQDADACSFAGTGFTGPSGPTPAGPFTLTGSPSAYVPGVSTQVLIGAALTGHVPLNDSGFVWITPNGAAVKVTDNGCSCIVTPACPEL